MVIVTYATGLCLFLLPRGRLPFIVNVVDPVLFVLPLSMAFRGLQLQPWCALTMSESVISIFHETFHSNLLSIFPLQRYGKRDTANS